MLKFSPYSYSKISSFEQCPTKFKFQYIDKINLFQQSKALEKGTRVHEIIELYEPTFYWKMKDFDYKLLSENEQKECEDLAVKFCKSDLGNKYLMHPGMLGHEMHVGLDTKLQPCNYYDKSAMLRGKIDFLIKDGKTLWVVDWKTGKVTDQRYMSNEQVMLYAIWGFNMFPDVDVIKADYVYVEHDDTYSFEFKRDNYKNFTKNYATKLKTIETEKEFPMKVGPLCNYCDYYHQDYCKGLE